MNILSKSSSFWPRSSWRPALAALSTGILVACGGGGGGSPASSEPAATPPPPAAPAAPAASAASLVEGTITGFGSVIIDGQRYDDSGVKVAFANNPESSSAASLGDLRTGMRVQADLKDGVLQNLAVNFALVGTLANINTAAGTLTVFGQTIKIVSGGQMPTVFEGFSSLSQLALGDLIKVAGSVASDGSISASRIERRLKDGSELFRLSGAVQNLDSTAKRFGLTGNSSVMVDYSQAKILPAGAAIENGKLVSLVSVTAPVSGVLTATVVEVKAKKQSDSKDFSVGGLVSDFQSLAAFRIGDVLVDASTATLKEGTVAADVANGAQAFAQGAITAGVLKASSLRVFKTDTAIQALLIGQVTDYVSLANFSLRGTAVDGSSAAFSKGQASDIAVGTWLKVSGQLTASGVKAKTIEVQAPPANKPAKLQGAISNLDLAAKKLTVLGVTVQWNDSSKFSFEGGLTLATLANGMTVSVEGSYDASSNVFTLGSLQASAPKSKPDTSRTVGFSGIAFNVSAGGFSVGSNAVLIGPNTSVQPSGSSLADLVNGARVNVKASLTQVDGKPVLTALSIEIEKPEKDSAGNSYLYLAGLISDYLSPSSFSVAGQKVDASGSGLVFIDGNAGKLANGAKVEIKGSLNASGVLVAVKLHFMPG
ncbi:hypothetical protein HNP55_002578 [Paucibacter oligotrophus]|uniref:DUF5666 domain-containing protein n=1 Tax=Roseateles oligotrophus TaxID=1769250 RepID=A0A840LBL1_9BURK|nr:DUF5666 domain-containing protein [Roseateles oligotrophus]MBB4844042.1 hypothetical protein [Roseateles oligotrophus]